MIPELKVFLKETAAKYFVNLVEKVTEKQEHIIDFLIVYNGCF